MLPKTDRTLPLLVHCLMEYAGLRKQTRQQHAGHRLEHLHSWGPFSTTTFAVIQTNILKGSFVLFRMIEILFT